MAPAARVGARSGKASSSKVHSAPSAGREKQGSAPRGGGNPGSKALCHRKNTGAAAGAPQLRQRQRGRLAADPPQPLCASLSTPLLMERKAEKSELQAQMEKHMNERLEMERRARDAFELKASMQRQIDQLRNERLIEQLQQAEREKRAELQKKVDQLEMKEQHAQMEQKLGESARREREKRMETAQKLAEERTARRGEMRAEVDGGSRRARCGSTAEISLVREVRISSSGRPEARALEQRLPLSRTRP